MRKLKVCALALLLSATSCGDDTFAPSSFSLLGVWSFSMNDAPGPGAPPGLVNPCEIRGARSEVRALSADTMAFGEPIGTIRCQLNGVWQEGSYRLIDMLVIYDTATGSVTFTQVNGDTALVGRAVASNRMSGTINATGWQGRVGTWFASR